MILGAMCDEILMYQEGGPRQGQGMRLIDCLNIAKPQDMFCLLSHKHHIISYDKKQCKPKYF